MPSNHRDILQHVCCDVESEDCVFGRCPDCQNKTSIDSLSEYIPGDNLGDTIKWTLWKRLDDGKCDKVQQSGTIYDALQLLSERLPAFKIHAFIKSKQAKTFNEVHATTGADHVRLQVDLSENATLLQQDEVQSAY